MRWIWVLPLLLVLASSRAAAAGNVQFSADALKLAPDRTERRARIYVGDNRVRVEYRRDGKTVVEIYDLQQQRALLLMPGQSLYMEHKGSEGGMMNPLLPATAITPCAWLQKAECRQLGKETLFDRELEKWEMALTTKDRKLHSLHWIDAERGMTLRQIWPDGTISELVPAGNETLNGRTAERYEFTATRPDGKSIDSTQWYDPELKIVIKEELPGGFYRELRNIEVGTQAGNLFVVPKGFRQVPAPGPGMGSRGGQPGSTRPAQ